MSLHQLKHCIQLWSSMNIYPSPPKLIVYHNTMFFFFKILQKLYQSSQLRKAKQMTMSEEPV